MPLDCILWMIGIENKFELRNVEDLVVELYQQKLQKEPSKTWVRSQLDVSIWDYSSNTRYTSTDCS